ncbi:class I SAM-dependent methyltransferase, partial [Bradyrhizobium manausense]|uniref:class I SAM-dependent methyltransferase n=1 Tax=Bradyrhizobium manausense TaxID=989370 RepID=UPI0012ECFF41
MAEFGTLKSTLRAVGSEGAYCCPASQEQARLWFIATKSPEDRSYHMAYSIALRGPLSVDCVASAIARCVARHDAFRTYFRADENGVWQIVEPKGGPALDVLDFSNYPEAQRPEIVIAEERAFAEPPFSLTTGPLARFRLLRLGEQDYRLIVVMHHIIGDGWSHAVVVRDFCSQYSKAACARPTDALEAEPLQYVDYAIWQQRVRAAGELDPAVDYWLARIDGHSAHPRLPFAGSEPAGSRAAHLSLTLDASLAAALQRYRVVQAVPLSAVMLTMYSGALATLADEPNFLIGIVTANRDEETADTVGFFSNTVAVPSPAAPGLSFDALIARSLGVLGDVQVYGRAPFDEVIARGGLANATRDGASLTALLVVQNMPQPHFEVPGVEISVSRIRVGAAKFPITLFVYETSGSVTLELEYAPESLSRDDAGALAERMCDVLKRGLANGAARVLDYASSVVSADSIACGVSRPEWLLRAVDELVAERAALKPDAIAIMDGRRTLSYREFVEQINAYAAELCACGLHQNSFVVVSLPRSAELLIAILAIMRAGAAWCPIDPDLPAAYKSSLVSSARPALAIATDILSDLRTIPPPNLNVVPRHSASIFSKPDLDCPCYVMHTSGTTGVAKGVIVPRRALANVTAWIADTLGLGPEDRTIWKTPIGFDAVCRELFPILVAGGTLRIAPLGVESDMAALGRLLREEQVTTFHCVPSQLQQLAQLECFPSCLRAIMCGGEALQTALAHQVLALGPRLFNVYGPTEATVDCAAYEVRGDEPHGILPIGRPIANTSISIVRDGCEVVAPAIGCLRVTGPGVAIGYTDQNLNSGSFGADVEGNRWYDTGDRAHLRGDGVIVFHGRVDRQLKLRGVRIEPSSIEAALCTEPGIGGAHIEFVDDEGLVAFVTPNHHAVDERFAAPIADPISEDWRAVFDTVYETIDASVPPELNTHGWIDSAMRLPLSREQVLCAIESTTERVLSWAPKKILEIGCGVWTLGARLAGRCESYHGVDFSEAAIAYCRASAEAAGMPHATFEIAEMSQFDPRGRRFDAIVLNSVIQYLPSQSIADALLAGLAGALDEAGYLFIGDVRNAALDPLLSLWRVWTRSRGDEPCGVVAIAAEVDQLNDPELRLHPGFFTSFAEKHGFAPPLIETKTATGSSEMARFRYDVTLTRELNGGIRVMPRLPIEVRPNDALVEEVRGLRALRAAPSTARLDSVLPRSGGFGHGILPLPEVGADLRLIMRPGIAPFDIDLLAIHRDADLHTSCHAVGYRQAPPPNTNSVGWRDFLTRVGTLRERLAIRLPAQAIPNRFVPIPRLPTSPNGKQDWATFRRLARDELVSAYRPPAAGSLEEVVAQAFEAVLGRRFGLDDDFFVLGGHSLLVTQARARLEQ